jgi:hypothetical protein
MKYGEIKWKVEKVVFQIDRGVVTRKSEIDEGRSHIKKASVPTELCIDTIAATDCPL